MKVTVDLTDIQVKTIKRILLDKKQDPDVDANVVTYIQNQINTDLRRVLNQYHSNAFTKMSPEERETKVVSIEPTLSEINIMKEREVKQALHDAE